MTNVNSVYYNLFYFYNNFVCSFFVEFLFNKFFLVKKKKKNINKKDQREKFLSYRENYAI